MLGGIITKTAIITGASGAIGSAVCQKLAREGYALCVHYHTNRNAAQNLCEALSSNETPAFLFQADLTDSQNTQEGISAALHFLESTCHGQAPDLFVHCAGKSQFGLLNTMEFDEIRKSLEENLLGGMFAARCVLPSMISKKNGNLVFITSMWGETGASCESVYSAAKAGLIGFAKALAKEHAPSHIRVNCVSPGFIETPMNSRLTAQEKTDFLADVPLSRAGLPDEIAEAVCFLASESASYITGEVLRVNGGYII